METSLKSVVRPLAATFAATMVLLTMTFASSAEAADFTVTKTTDSADPGTLRRALIDAYASNDSDDRILFAPGVSGAINLNADLPGFTGPLEIKGPGAGQLAIDGGNAHAIFTGFGSDFTVSGLTLRNGLSAVDVGGGIMVDHGSLTLRDSRLVGNSAPTGGGGFIANASDLSVSNTVISDNAANVGAGGLITGTAAHSAVIDGASFSKNESISGGGGLAILIPTDGEVESTKVRILNSEFTGNSASAATGDFLLGGGGVYSGTSDITVESSLFENNSSAYAAGGIVISAPLPANKASILNSTFVGNTAELAGGGIYSRAIGLNVDSSTVTGNQTVNPLTPEYLGGGLLAVLGQATVTNSIVSGNTPEDVSSVPVSEQYDGAISGSFNLIGAKSKANYTEAVLGSDIQSSDPKLGPLADNGGPTKTMFPAANSPVVNKGLSYLETDQRGLLRPVKFGSIPFSTARQANGADIGAVELQTNKFTFGKVKLNKKLGLAILPVNVPSGGKIILEGSPTVSGQSKVTKKMATINFKVRAKGKSLKKLQKVGTVKVKMAFTFRPTGGIAASKNKTIRLAMKKRRQ